MFTSDGRFEDVRLVEERTRKGLEQQIETYRAAGRIAMSVASIRAYQGFREFESAVRDLRIVVQRGLLNAQDDRSMNQVVGALRALDDILGICESSENKVAILAQELKKHEDALSALNARIQPTGVPA